MGEMANLNQALEHGAAALVGLLAGVPSAPSEVDPPETGPGNLPLPQNVPDLAPPAGAGGAFPGSPGSSGPIGLIDAYGRRPTASLVPYARNSRTHSDEQIAQLVESMREWGFTMPVLIDEAGGIIAGHGRVMAATRLGLPEVPVLVATGWSEDKKAAYVIADNKIALNAGWDEAMLGSEYMRLQGEGFRVDVLGFNADELLELLTPAIAAPKTRARRRSRGGPEVEVGGSALDHAIAEIEEGLGERVDRAAWSPSTSWAQAGPILRREQIDLRCKPGVDGGPDVWTGNAPGFLKESHVDPLVAGLRAVLAKHRSGGAGV